MARLIDADKLRKDVLDLPDCYNGFSDTYDKARILDLVDEQPTVKPKQGHWIDRNDGIIAGTCSVCGWNACLCETDVSSMPYCPNCGTKMSRGKDEY